MAGAAVLALLPHAAGAHVKWFCAVADCAQPPAPLGRVLSPLFAAVAGVFVALVFAGFLLDGFAGRRWPRLVAQPGATAVLEEKLLRLAVGGYFLLLWDKGAVVLWERGSALLTPELMAAAGWMGALQFLVASGVAFRATLPVAAAAICILYIYGIAQFGIFHMTDYVFFPGIAAYLALSWLGNPWALRWRTMVLSGGLAFGLMWTAVEKFLYPQWTLDIVGRHPDLAFGFPWPFAVLTAGFVEFTLAFNIMLGRGLVRFGALAYAAIFLAAVPEFGHLDAVGHLPIIGILVVVALHGGSPLQRLCGLHLRGRVANAGGVAGLYVASLVAFVAMYYCLQWAEYG
jgi:hypothetical protein